MLLHKDLPAATRFFSEGLGLKVQLVSEKLAELRCAAGTKVTLKKRASDDGDEPKG